MATSSIHETLIINDNIAARNFCKALANPQKLPQARTKTTSEEKQERKIFDTWLYAHSMKK